MLVKDLVNTRSKGIKYGYGAYIVEMEKFLSLAPDKFEEEKLRYLITDLSEKTLLINDIASLDVKKVANNEHIKEVEENTEKPEISEEDILYVEQVINNSMNKSLKIVRDDNKNLKIVLENKEFLGIDRDKLPLSTGEISY